MLPKIVFLGLLLFGLNSFGKVEAKMDNFHLSETSKRNLAEVHPDLSKVIRYALKISLVDFRVIEGARSRRKQARYVKQGISRTLDSKHLAQENGLAYAVDVVPIVGGKVRWDWATVFVMAEAIRSAAKFHQVEIIWGGAWTTLNDTKKPLELIVNDYKRVAKAKGERIFLDGVHFELKFSER